MATFGKDQVLKQGSLAKFAAWAECYKVYQLPNGHSLIAIRSERDEQAMFGSSSCRGAKLVWAQGQNVPFDWDSFAVQTYQVMAETEAEARAAAQRNSIKPEKIIGIKLASPARPSSFTVETHRAFAQTEAEARASAPKAGIKPDKLIEIKPVNPARTGAVEDAGVDEAQAGASAKTRLPAEAVEVGVPRTTQPKQTGVLEIQAKSETEARERWKLLSGGAGLVKLTEDEIRERRQTGIPSGAVLDDFVCSTAPQKGIFGLGKKPGTWKAHWSTPVRVQIAYTLPPQWAVTYRAHEQPARPPEWAITYRA